MFLVCGEALFDVFVGDGPASAFPMEARAGGSPYNVAIGLARLGQKSALLTGVSRDVLGERLAQQLTREGVETRFLVRSGRRTTLSLVGLDGAGHPAYTFYGVGSADCSLTPDDLPTLPPTITGLHFGSYSIAVSPTADAFATLAQREKHRFISLDPNVRPTIEPDMAVWRRRIDALLAVATTVKASTEDLSALYPAETIETVARRWLSQGPALVVITDGANGATAYTANARVHAPAQKVKVVDTVGAGDAFQAALLWQLLTGNLITRGTIASLPKDRIASILTTAIRAAGLTCTRRGADLPDAADLAGS